MSTVYFIVYFIGFVSFLMIWLLILFDFVTCICTFSILKICLL